jgi:hypothetical protein
MSEKLTIHTYPWKTTDAQDLLDERDAALAEVKRLEEREIYWREYVDLLGEAVDEHTGLAVAHGWKGNSRHYHEGIRLRGLLGITVRDRQQNSAAPLPQPPPSTTSGRSGGGGSSQEE